MHKGNKKSKTNIIVSIILILIGTYIYVLYRQNIIFKNYLNLDHIYHYQDCNNNLIKYYLIYCLPDALWYFALLLIQIALLRDHFLSRFLLIISMLLPFVLEILQLFNKIKGTFDIKDVYIYVITLLVILWKERKRLFLAYYN